MATKKMQFNVTCFPGDEFLSWNEGEKRREQRKEREICNFVRWDTHFHFHIQKVCSFSFFLLSFTNSSRFSFHNLLGEVMYSLFFLRNNFFERAHHCWALKAFYFYLTFTINVPCHHLTLDMDIDVQLSPLDTVLVTMVTFWAIDGIPTKVGKIHCLWSPITLKTSMT